jgi:NADH-quinone oxidoreductase subunit F
MTFCSHKPCHRTADHGPIWDVSEVDAMVARLGRRPENLIPLLQAVQARWNWLPPAALERLCEITDITPAAVTGVSTFYHLFRHEPVGRHIIRTCIGTACHVSGAETLYDTVRSHLKLAPGRHTDAQGLFTVERVACLGCCMLAPVVQIDNIIYGHVQTRSLSDLLRDFLATQNATTGGSDSKPHHGGSVAGEVRICLCSSCVAGGSAVVFDELTRLVRDLGLPARVKNVGCTGISSQTPLVEVARPGDRRYRYGQVKSGDCRRLLLNHFQPTHWAKRFGARVFHALETLFTDESWTPPTRYSADVRPYIDDGGTGRQKRICTEHAGLMEPLSLDDYLAHDGFQALETCLKARTPEQIIAEIKASGLRGRGGAGFPTGQKWEATRASADPIKYIICNGDEGDPGAFMDRMILESFPFRVLEGMIIAAKAIGSCEGVLYIRAEYPLATRHIRAAIKLCTQRGYLGENILGTGFGLNLRVVEGAGAFVCGEETALMAAIEGGRGMPHFRPPFPAQSGLWGKPTLINNVETFAAVSWIIRNGAAAFAALGSEKSRGSKTFALAGKIRRGGLIEVPMGMTIHEIVHDIGGGIAGGHQFKAVLMGGPSGGCVPASLSRTPVDYEALRNVGAIMGSGGMVVLDDTDCLVDVARYFISFCQDESCGKCTHCRIGTMRMKEILDRLCAGRGRTGDLEKLETLASLTSAGSLCGLGKTAPNPVRSSLNYFRDEYEAHLRGVCPAKRCKALIEYRVTDACFGCTRCAQFCPAQAIPMNPYHRHEIEEPACTRCDICRQVCPVNAIEIVDLSANQRTSTTTQLTEIHQATVLPS